VGIAVLSAAVGNDIGKSSHNLPPVVVFLVKCFLSAPVGWTLLASSVALVNAGSGLTALWILMVCVGWTLVLLFPVKKALRWLAMKTGSIENGPTIFL